MKLSQLKEWANSLPKEFDDFQVITREFGDLTEEFNYYLDKPIVSAAVDEEHQEIFFMDEKNNTIFASSQEQ